MTSMTEIRQHERDIGVVGKAFDVFNSCETPEQVEVAHRYAKLARRAIKTKSTLMAFETGLAVVIHRNMMRLGM